MKKILLFIVLFCGFGGNFLKAQPAEDSLQISVITCAPGGEMYSEFGHSAVRVRDKKTGTDIVFNYGVVNFQMPYFYFKFARGQMDYMLVAEHFEQFIYNYVQENRQITEQVLNLTEEQKINIYKFLINNALPENRVYRYDFLRDNCATRPLDVILQFAGKKLLLPEHLQGEGKTYRELIESYLPQKKWDRFLINLGMGAPADRTPDLKGLCFLPDYLADYLNKTAIEKDGKKEPLIKSQNIIFSPQPRSPQKTSLTPLLFTALFLLTVIFLTIIELQRKSFFLWFDKSFFLFCGIAGLFMLALWLLTEHTVTAYNGNLFWAMPLFILTAFRLKRKVSPWIAYFHLIIAILLAGALIIDLSVFNLFDFAAIPLALSVLLRSALLGFRK